MMYIAAFCAVVIVLYTLSCLFHKEPKRYEHHDEFFKRLSRDSDPNATIWSGRA